MTTLYALLYAFKLFVNKTNATNEEKESLQNLLPLRETIVTFIAANCRMLQKKKKTLGEQSKYMRRPTHWPIIQNTCKTANKRQFIVGSCEFDQIENFDSFLIRIKLFP